MSARHDPLACGARADGAAEPGIPVGISACLLGRQVRFDGGHKRSAYAVETLGRAFAWHPVCPEVGIGLGTPRESLRHSLRRAGRLRPHPWAEAQVYLRPHPKELAAWA